MSKLGGLTAGVIGGGVAGAMTGGVGAAASVLAKGGSLGMAAKMGAHGVMEGGQRGAMAGHHAGQGRHSEAMKAWKGEGNISESPKGGPKEKGGKEQKDSSSNADANVPNNPKFEANNSKTEDNSVPPTSDSARNVAKEPEMERTSSGGNSTRQGNTEQSNPMSSSTRGTTKEPEMERSSSGGSFSSASSGPGSPINMGPKPTSATDPKNAERQTGSRTQKGKSKNGESNNSPR